MRIRAYRWGVCAPLREGSHPLTSRERQVLQLVGEGKSSKEIAVLLGISIKAAESHRTRLMRKLGIHELASLVRYAIRRGLVQPYHFPWQGIPLVVSELLPLKQNGYFTGLNNFSRSLSYVQPRF
jgi:DNA-binding CsgD family transcriptional regulator